jgi:hypothetical protein
MRYSVYGYREGGTPHPRGPGTLRDLSPTGGVGRIWGAMAIHNHTEKNRDSISKKNTEKKIVRIEK